MKKMSFWYDKMSPTIDNTQKNPPYIKSQRLPPISFNTQLTNITKKWSTVPLFSGPTGSNYSRLLKNIEKQRNLCVNNNIPIIKSCFPEPNKYTNETRSKLIQMNAPIIKSRFPDKCIGNCFTTETKSNYIKHNI